MIESRMIAIILLAILIAGFITSLAFSMSLGGLIILIGVGLFHIQQKGMIRKLSA